MTDTDDKELDSAIATLQNKINELVMEETEYESADAFFEEGNTLQGDLELTADEAKTLEEATMQSYAFREIEYPDSHVFLTIGRLSLRIKRKEENVEEDIRKGIEDFKESIDYEQQTTEEQERIGVIITEVIERVSPGILNREIIEDFLLFQTLISELIPKYTQDLFLNEIIIEDYRNSSKTKDLINELSQEQIEALLLRGGVISEPVRSELSHVRDVRNRVVHDIRERTTLEKIDSVSSEVERSITALNDVIEQAEGRRPIGNE